MRADRLISLLMLLQSRGRLTAQELAGELGVSERTIYRDVDALCQSGVPVYTEHGPGGGFSLLDSYRTNLTGMTEEELRALFMLTIPGPLERLGISQELRSAFLKLSASLPASRRANEELVQQRFYMDWDWWFQAEEPVPHLAMLKAAVWESHQVLLSYRIITGTLVKDNLFDPYALVAKAGVWFLVAAHAGRYQVLRVSDLTDARPSGEYFVRLPGFDLPRFWQNWCAEAEKYRKSFPVEVRLSPVLLPLLPLYFGHGVQKAVQQAGPPEADGWLRVTLHFENFYGARDRLLSLGRAVEVIEPVALRCSILDYARQVLDLYGA